MNRFAARVLILTITGGLSGCVSNQVQSGDALQRMETSCIANMAANGTMEEAQSCMDFAARMRARRVSQRQDNPQGRIREMETSCMANSMAKGRPRSAMACMDFAEQMQRRQMGLLSGDQQP